MERGGEGWRGSEWEVVRRRNERGKRKEGRGTVGKGGRDSDERGRESNGELWSDERGRES